MKLPRIHKKKAVVVGAIAAVLVLTGVAAVIGVVRSRDVLLGQGDGGLAPGLVSGDDASTSVQRDMPQPEPADGSAAKLSVTGEEGAASSGAGGSINATLPPLTAPGQQLIRNGDVTIIVARNGIGQAMDRVTEITRALGGYVLSANMSTADDGLRPDDAVSVSTDDEIVADPAIGPQGADPYAQITLRVPAQRFDDALARLQKVGRVHALATSTDDVTSQVVDLKARLRHYRAVEARLLTFLDKANTVAAALAVQDRIAETQITIEELEGQLKQISHMVAYSTISLSLTEKTPQVVAASGGFWDTLVHSLRLVGEGFQWIVLALGAVLPFAVVLGLVVWAAFWGRRQVRRRRHTHDGPTPPAPDTV